MMKQPKADSALVVGKITGANHPFVEHYKFFAGSCSRCGWCERLNIPFQHLQFYFELIRDAEHVEQLNTIYPDFAAVHEDIKQTYLQVIQDLYDAGLRTLQVDDCTWVSW